MNKLKWIICSCCEGNGTTEHPAFSNGFTSSEWQSMSSEEQKAYMGGAYDVSCEKCTGLGRVQVPNVAALSFAEKRVLVLDRKEARENAQLDREIRAEMAAERAFGC